MDRHALASRVCKGCGEAFQPTRANQDHHPGSSRCRVRAHRARSAKQASTAYVDTVWKARRAGAIDFYEAVELLVRPSEAIVHHLAVAA